MYIRARWENTRRKGRLRFVVGGAVAWTFGVMVFLPIILFITGRLPQLSAEYFRYLLRPNTVLSMGGATLLILVFFHLEPGFRLV
jgi:hypothetical protein